MIVNYRVLLWTIIIYFFVFQRALTDLWSGFNYFDELMALIVLLDILLNIVKKSNKLQKDENSVLYLIIAANIIGLLSSFINGIMTNVFLIAVDFISMIKVWLSFYWILLDSKNANYYDKLIILMSKIARVLTLIMFFCMIISQAIDIGMGWIPRYGFVSFKFVFNNAGNFSKYFYFAIPLLTADLYYHDTIRKRFFIVLNLIIWVSTMRSRAFAFVALYSVMFIYFFSKNGKKYGDKIKSKFKIWYVIPLGIIAVSITWNQLLFYFFSDTQARSLLLRYGIITMLSFFPFGAGLGTFGSDIASSNYSQLYYDYGFNYIYGLRPGETFFLNDNYWPMVMGQLGIIGLLFTIIALYKLSKLVLKETKNNKYFYFASFCAIGFLMISSVASKSYSEYSSICVFLLLGLLVKNARKTQGLDKEEYR